jgi:hypothetical protein
MEDTLKLLDPLLAETRKDPLRTPDKIWISCAVVAIVGIVWGDFYGLP